MAILKMEKFHLIILNKKREELLREFQIFRNIEFSKTILDENENKLKKFDKIDIEKKIEEYDETLNKINTVLEFVTKYDSNVSSFKETLKGLPNYTFEELEEKIKNIKLEKEYIEIKKLKDNLELIEANLLKKRELIEELKPFSPMDISFKDMRNLKHYEAIVGEVSWKLVQEFENELKKLDNIYLEEINIYDKEHYYFIIYDKKDTEMVEDSLKIGNFNKISLDIDKTPAQEIKILNNEIEKLQLEKSKIIEIVGKKQEILEDFKLEYEYIENLKVRLLAEEEFMASSNTCLIEGYLPAFEEDRFKEIIKKVCNDEYNLEIEDVEKDSEDVPIMLKNNKFIRVFESITSIYAMPKYNEIDPTPLYAPLYALFFGMMSADFGYGMILIILTTLGLKFVNFTPSMKKNVKFFQLLGISTAIWGFLYGSYFGGHIPGIWKFLDLGTEFMTVLVLAVAIGGIHLFYALAIKGYMEYRDKQYVEIFFDVISWYIALGGIIVLLLSVAGVIPKLYKDIGLYTMIVGIIILIIAGARATKGNIGAKLAAGLYNVYGISSYVGDFVSYSRLMALGMAGGYIAFSINMIAGMLWGKSIIADIGAIIILVFFHIFNLFLSCLGAYVHALRLIYVEFFGKFYEGGGKPFKYFRNESKYINLDRQFED